MMTHCRTDRERTRRTLIVLLVLTLSAALALILVDPISQDETYHHFADRRSVAGLANVANVISNLPLLLVGLVGISRCMGQRSPGLRSGSEKAQLVFFAGIVLSALGSAFYHLEPDNGRLFWDRLALTLVFTAFFDLVLGEFVDGDLAGGLLPILVLFGLLTVIFWQLTGDLRPYALVQFLPCLLVSVILVLHDSPHRRRADIVLVLLVYGLAKLLEISDRQVFDLLQVSGHSLKHLAAAAAAWLLLPGRSGGNF